ncbi:endonuclease/exonuclease/phosphatase family protein [Gordonia malaquae]|nr:endonuclease/exonuclease/phosphatase family protein [Gordonia malaquae]
MRMFLRRASVVVGVAALTTALVAVGIRYWPGGNVPTIAAASVSPYVFAIAIVVAAAAVFALRGRTRWVGGTMVAVVAVSGVAVHAPLFVSDDPPTGEALTVLTSNIQLGMGDISELASLVRKNEVDVLAVEELTPDAVQRISESTIARDLPYSFVRPRTLAGGTAIYSRYELSAPASLDGFGLENLTAVVTVPNVGEVQVFAVHPVPPSFPSDWAEELDRLRAAIGSAPSERPVIALGDFNATTDHTQFRRLLSGGFADAADLAGAGLLPTYPTDKWYPPVVGIDHVLLRGFGASAVTTHTISGADHRAVLATIGAVSITRAAMR